ncbi:hypothetical protein JAAARDRAFT_432011 [Jaapia argillacea MUCL 33604]|uniref:Uncharacterized protein n=1 Tax=Jaapia argillacea MUCL 33604 TaxID=933084 RepID=A0A067PHG6_9AGAM|nr:hypothetical protein JAAARDRAFT_432011 [Jaapia argillacea MUCL 33604]
MLNCGQFYENTTVQQIQLVIDYSTINQSNISTDINFYTIQHGSLDMVNTESELFDLVIPTVSAFPMPLGARLRGTTFLGARRVMKPSWKDVLGVGADFLTFNTYTHGNLIADRAAELAFPENVSTLLLSPAVDFTDFIIQEDYRQHTLIVGLASIGGLLTIIEGGFAMLFGMTLFQVLLGSKVISPFGALGIMMREKLRRALHEQYPALRRQMQEGGIATFLSDVAVDLRILDDDAPRDSNPPLVKYTGVWPATPGSPVYEFTTLYNPYDGEQTKMKSYQ